MVWFPMRDGVEVTLHSAPRWRGSGTRFFWPSPSQELTLRGSRVAVTGAGATASMRVRVLDADVLVAGLERVLGDGLAAARVGETEDMRIGGAVDALEQVRDLPHHQWRIADAIPVADVNLNRLPASEKTQGELRCLTVSGPSAGASLEQRSRH